MFPWDGEIVAAKERIDGGFRVMVRRGESYLQALARSAILKAFLCSAFIQSERDAPGAS
jgi:hypothetical protein